MSMTPQPEPTAGVATRRLRQVYSSKIRKTASAVFGGALLLGLSMGNVAAVDDLMTILSAAEDMDPFYREAQDSAKSI